MMGCTYNSDGNYKPYRVTCQIGTEHISFKIYLVGSAIFIPKYFHTMKNGTNGKQKNEVDQRKKGKMD